MKTFFSNIFNEIRSQPAHIREVFMWICVVITFSVISFFWAQSTATQLTAAINPQRAKADRALTQQKDRDQASTVANIGDSLLLLKGNLFGLLGLGDDSIRNTNYFSKKPVNPNLFPLSKNK